MSTRPLGARPVVPDDPGAWSGILDVLQRRGALPGRRRAEPANGLMISPPPRTALPLVGTQEGVAIAGVGPVRAAAAAREAALSLVLGDDGTSLGGVSKMVTRTWELATLALTSEQHPDADPVAGLPPDVWIDDVADGDLPAAARVAPGGEYAAVPVVEPPRYRGLALVRLSDRALVRYIRFARCGLWSPDGARLVLGGEWGLLALDHHVPEPKED